MIRIYLDWNVFSGLKNPRTEDLRELKELIQENKNHSQFIYSDTHFEDLIKSYMPDNKYFNEDLNNLDYLTEGHRISHDGKNTKPYLHLPSDYFKSLKTVESY